MNVAKRAWYARHRAQRFSRRFGVVRDVNLSLHAVTA